MNETLIQTISRLSAGYSAISAERAGQLRTLANIITDQLGKGSVVLNFICTHNSRRSQISQAWAFAASRWFGIQDVVCVSGGTEVTAFNSRAVKALTEQGFQISMRVKANNPGYLLSLNGDQGIEMYSKTYQQATLESFVAVMTCSHADAHCPMVTGALFRFSLPFIDPGISDGTPDEHKTYLNTADKIGIEMLYLFSLVKESLS